jgi:hypothetical protein
MVGLVSRCDWAAVGRVKANLGKGKVVKDGSIGQLGTDNRQQQRLHHQRIDRRRANQPSPESPQSQIRVALPDSHDHELMLIHKLKFYSLFRE